MSIPDRYLPFWQMFAGTWPVDPSPRFLEAFHFDDNRRDADDLASLVLSGTKRATAALLWTHEASAKPVPRPGDLSIVTDFDGDAICVIETVRVDVVPFCDVSAEFATVEGEGDGSLTHWRRVHAAYFARECARLGREPTPGMPVVCERFDVVYRPDPTGPCAS